LVSAAFALTLLGGGIHAGADELPHVPPVTAAAWTQEDLVDKPLYSQTDHENIYVVQPGDSLWSIAENVYGDGRQWTLIAHSNEDVLNGSIDLIQVGWRLVIPAKPEESVCTPNETVVVQPGDSLWAIAETHLGDGGQWPKVAAANPSIANPRQIEPGWELKIPCEKPPSLADVDENSDIATESTLPQMPEPLETSSPEDIPDGLSSGVEAVTDAWETWSSPTTHDAEDSVSLSRESTSEVPTDPGDEENFIASPETIGVSAALASGMALMIGRRRLNQLRARPVGRRILHPGTEGRRFASALDLVGAQTTVPSATARLSGLVEDMKSLKVFDWTDSDLSKILSRNQPEVETFLIDKHGMAISVGEDLEGNPVIAEIGGSVPFLVTSERGEGLSRVMRGIAMNMAVEECLGGTELHVVTNNDLFDSFENLHRHVDADDALQSMKEITTNRLGFIGDNDWNRLKEDPNCGEAWRSVVFIFTNPVNTTQYTQLSDSLAGPNLGVAAVVPMIVDAPTTIHLPSRGLRVESENQAILCPQEITVRPHQLQPSEPMGDLLETSVSEETTQAWWVSESDIPASPCLHVTERYPDMHSSMMNTQSGTPSTTFSHPTLRLLGPITLEGARGTPISRAERSCMEYCGWLLEYPGTTAMAMAQGLMVAESTRRSNMSRLRGWLGSDENANPYLPEAYSGRIWLDPAVTSDWHRMCLLVNRGIEEAATDNLLEALTLVRGAPLADATPGQWHWAEELRTDMVSLIRDIGVVATNRCVANQEIDKARWAASRALTAAPEDEMLLCARVRTEHCAGNRMEVERLASWISRNARNLGIDLFPDTVKTLHHVLGTLVPDKR
jgi:LysM repeat protein